MCDQSHAETDAGAVGPGSHADPVVGDHYLYALLVDADANMDPAHGLPVRPVPIGMHDHVGHRLGDGEIDSGHIAEHVARMLADDPPGARRGLRHRRELDRMLTR